MTARSAACHCAIVVAGRPAEVKVSTPLPTSKLAEMLPKVVPLVLVKARMSWPAWKLPVIETVAPTRLASSGSVRVSAVLTAIAPGAALTLST